MFLAIQYVIINIMYLHPQATPGFLMSACNILKAGSGLGTKLINTIKTSYSNSATVDRNIFTGKIFRL